MKTRILTTLSVLAMVAAAQAAETTFDFKDPKGVNNVVFKLDAPLESINGTANGVSGTVTFDPENPAATKGKIVVETKSLTVQNSMMQGHLVGPEWLNAEANPEITFEITKVDDVEKKGDKIEADVTGKFTLKGVTKEIEVDAKVTYLPGKLGDRTGGKLQGDLLVIRSNFEIKRSDFGIKPGEYADKVAETIELSLSVAGSAPKK